MNSLTWDVTYQGLPLDQRAYDATITALRKLTTGPVGSLGLSTCDDGWYWHQALVALAQCGVTETILTPGSLYGSRTQLTAYGKRYASDRGVTT